MGIYIQNHYDFLFFQMNKIMKTIATHSGTFHADESLAVFMLRQLPEYRDAQLVRTRDPAVIQNADIVVDVGGVYDPDTHRYDHHQRGFIETFTGYDIKLSSAGLVYKHFGKRVLESIVQSPIDDLIYLKVYDELILMFDGVDNGVDRYPGKQKYVDSTGISARVGRLNPAWNQPVSDDLLDSRFLEAVELTGAELTHKVSVVN